MIFTKFSIKNFKSFKTEQYLLFAKPVSNREGSGLTYIVGANNSGKTTIIEGLSIKNNRKIKSSELVSRSDCPEFALYEEENVVRKCVLIRPESYTIEENPRLSDEEQFEIISSRRHWESTANRSLSSVGESFISSHEFQNRQSSIEVASELKAIEADSKKYGEFIQLVKRVIPEFSKFAVGYEDYEYIEYVSASGIHHKSELLGDGVITIIRILLQLFVNKKNPLIIDEPELSLHPSAQRKLLKVIAEYSIERQIVISTHSPYFIDWNYLESGAVLNRIVKQNDTYSQIYSIEDFSLYSSLIKAANWQQPFLMDEVAKEIFFTEDKIIFLEGQEDVGLLKRESVFTNANIFGYGVRGKDNFKLFVSLAHKIGFKEVACLLDNGENETEIKKELEADFPSYKIVQWNRDDIRDKDIISYPVKNGYFTQAGTKKNDSELDDYNLKITAINDYFSK